MKKKRIKIKKTFRGWAELRDYDVDECIEKDISAEVEYGDDVMTLSPSQLENNVVNITNVFASIKGGKSYRLRGYVWEPDND